MVARIDRAIEDALDTGERVATAGSTTPRLDAPLGRYWFWIDADGRLRVPHVRYDAAVDSAVSDRPPAGHVEDYLRELSRRQDRAAKLRAAQRAQGGHADACAAAFADAKRQYAALVAFDDTGPDALLGLART